MVQQISATRGNLSSLAGRAASPLAYLGNSLRDSRLFQPSGLCFQARVKAKQPIRPSLQPLAKRLAGSALVRMAAGLWEEEHRLLPDLLSCSIRFNATKPAQNTPETQQDLVLYSARSPWSLALDSIKTNQRDYLLNRYYGLWPYELDGQRNMHLRISPAAQPATGEDRNERLLNAVHHGGVVLVLEVCDEDFSHEWQPLVEIHLERLAQQPADSFRFSPFHDGQGIRPQGLIEYMRPVPELLDRLTESATQQAVQAVDRVGEQSARTTEQVSRKAAQQMEQIGQRAGTLAMDSSERASGGMRDLGERAADLERRTSSLAHNALTTAGNLVRHLGHRAEEVRHRVVDLLGGLRGQVVSASSEVAQKTVEAGREATDQAARSARRTSQAARHTADQVTQKTAQVSRKATAKAERASAKAAASLERATETAQEASERIAKGAQRSAAEVKDASQDVQQRVRKAGQRIGDEAQSTAEGVAKTAQASDKPRVRAQARSNGRETQGPH